MTLNIDIFYSPHVNFFSVPILFGVPFSLLVIYLILSFTLFLKNVKMKNCAMLLICLLVFVSILFQFIDQRDYMTKLVQLMSHKSFTQKKKILLGRTFDLISCAQDKLRGKRYQGEFISSLNSSRLTPSIFRYELYPVINLTSTSTHPEVLVCFHSDQCAQMPKDFHPLCWGEDGYIALRGDSSV